MAEIYELPDNNGATTHFIQRAQPHDDPTEQIYDLAEIRGGPWVAFSGAELDALCRWWFTWRGAPLVEAVVFMEGGVAQAARANMPVSIDILDADDPPTEHNPEYGKLPYPVF